MKKIFALVCALGCLGFTLSSAEANPEAVAQLKKVFESADKNGDGVIGKPQELAALLVKLNGPLLHMNDVKKLVNVKIKPEEAKRPLPLDEAIRNLYRTSDPDADGNGEVSFMEFEDFTQQVLKDRDALIDLAEAAMLPPVALPVAANPINLLGFIPNIANHDRDIDDCQEQLRERRKRLEEEREERARQRLLDEILSLERRLAAARLAREAAMERARQDAANNNGGNELQVGNPGVERPVYNGPQNSTRPPNMRVEIPEQRKPDPVRREFTAPPQRSEPPRMIERSAPSRPEPRVERPEPVKVNRPEPKEEKKPEPKSGSSFSVKK